MATSVRHGAVSSKKKKKAFCCAIQSWPHLDVFDPVAENFDLLFCLLAASNKHEGHMSMSWRCLSSLSVCVRLSSSISNYSHLIHWTCMNQSSLSVAWINSFTYDPTRSFWMVSSFAWRFVFKFMHENLLPSPACLLMQCQHACQMTESRTSIRFSMFRWPNEGHGCCAASDWVVPRMTTVKAIHQACLRTYFFERQTDRGETFALVMLCSNSLQRSFATAENSVNLVLLFALVSECMRPQRMDRRHVCLVLFRFGWAAAGVYTSILLSV